MFIWEINQSIDSLKGVGSALSARFLQVNIRTIADLIYYFPRTYIDRSQINLLTDFKKKPYLTVKVKIIKHEIIYTSKKKFLKIIIQDKSAKASLVCFNRNYLQESLKVNSLFLISGVFTFTYGEIQCSQFEYEEISEKKTDNKSPDFDPILPVYSLTNGISQKLIRKLTKQVFEKILSQPLNDEIPSILIKKNQLVLKHQALHCLHFPDSFKDLQNAVSTLIYEEAFYFSLSVNIRKIKFTKIKKNISQIERLFKKEILKNLPFCLTESQQKALQQIEEKLSQPYVCQILLQGDVGCGKTIIALLAALNVIESGKQVAFMVPTEILTKQQYQVIRKLTLNIRLDMAYLNNSLSKIERENILTGLKNGTLKLIIGTHSLFSKDVCFNKLGLVIIDEQQRFGVNQRLNLIAKGKYVDCIYMTATPIPRTLALSIYADLHQVIIDQIPAGRKPVKTYRLANIKEKQDNMYDWIKKELDKGNVAYFIYPLINESENFNLKNLSQSYQELQKIFSEYSIGLVHSQLSDEEKQNNMDKLLKGDIQVLAATSVIEVGIDIPQATVMVIEHADRYGLSTLHQLRGRIGRSDKQAYLFLVANNDISERAKQRLKIMREENDGFKIAEKDLLMRGPGEFLGIRQSGLPDFKVADLTRDAKLFLKAKQDVTELIEKNEYFSQRDHDLVKWVLEHRFENIDLSVLSG